MTYYLQINEALVSVRCHCNSSQDCTNDKRADIGCCWSCVYFQHVVRNHTSEHWCRAFLLEYQKTHDQAFHAQQIVAVCWHLNFVDHCLRSTFGSAACIHLLSVRL